MVYIFRSSLLHNYLINKKSPDNMFLGPEPGKSLIKNYSKKSMQLNLAI